MKSIQQQCVERIYELLPHKKELKFGCEVIKSEMYQGVVVGEAYEQIAYLNYGAMKVYLAPKEHFEIIGQPITISNVINAVITYEHHKFFDKKERDEAIIKLIDLAEFSKDNLLEQSNDFCKYLWVLIK